MIPKYSITSDIFHFEIRIYIHRYVQEHRRMSDTRGTLHLALGVFLRMTIPFEILIHNAYNNS